jgi:hypothetical protein
MFGGLGGLKAADAAAADAAELGALGLDADGKPKSAVAGLWPAGAKLGGAGPPRGGSAPSTSPTIIRVCAARFAWAHRARNSPKRRFPARAAGGLAGAADASQLLKAARAQVRPAPPAAPRPCATPRRNPSPAEHPPGHATRHDHGARHDMA